MIKRKHKVGIPRVDGRTLVLFAAAFAIVGMCLLTFAIGEDDAKGGIRFSAGSLEYEIVSGKDMTVKVVGHGDVPEHLAIPGNVTYLDLDCTVVSIGESVFEGCKEIRTLVIPDSVKSLGTSAFKGCTGITELTVPIHLNTVVKNKNPAFGGCKGIEKVTLTAGTGDGHEYGDNTYTPWRISKGSFKTLVLGDGIESIGKNTFEDCKSLTEALIPEGVTKIGEYAFYDCGSLETLIISDSVVKGGAYAFAHCDNLKNLTMPISLKTIYDDGAPYPGSSTNYLPMFYKCHKIENITLTVGNGNATDYNDVHNGGWFSGEYTPWGITKSLKTLVISEGVKAIGPGTFKGTGGDFKLVLPDSLEKIGKSAFKGFKFYGTDGGKSIDITPENLKGKTFMGKPGKMVEQ